MIFGGTSLFWFLHSERNGERCKKTQSCARGLTCKRGRGLGNILKRCRPRILNEEEQEDDFDDTLEQQFASTQQQVAGIFAQFSVSRKKQSVLFVV